MEGEEDEATMLMVMEATGLDQEAALLLLADHKWDSQLAIETFFAVPTPTSPRPSEGRLPPHLQNPSSSFETLGADSLLETNYQRANSKATTKTTSRSKKKKPIVEVFRDFSQERGKKKGNNKKAESLSELFRPPVELIFPGSFEEAKAFASQQKRLLVVALIHFDIFDCQRMNRDTWKHHQVADLLREDFVFWQAYSGESESVLYESFYSKNGLPHTSVLDPMTGERLGSWDGFVDGPQMASELQRVLCEFVPQQEEKKMARGKQKKYESEEEQFERAVRESLQELKNDPIKGDPANLFDSDYDNPSEEYDFDYDSSPFGFEEEERGKEERGKEERGKEERGKEERGKEEREGEEREEEQRVTENGEGKKEEERGKEDRKRRRDGGRLKGEEEEDGRREESKKKRKIEEEKERNREEKREKGKGGKREEEMKKREEIKEEKEVRKEEKRGQEEEERKKENGEIKVDPSRPTISLQVRLVNGKKITIEANTFHTISDLYSHILAHKENRTKSFTLATSFPKRELKDKDQDLETAGLAKALIVQHPK